MQRLSTCNQNERGFFLHNWILFIFLLAMLRNPIFLLRCLSISSADARFCLLLLLLLLFFGQQQLDPTIFHFGVFLNSVARVQSFNRNLNVLVECFVPTEWCLDGSSFHDFKDALLVNSKNNRFQQKKERKEVNLTNCIPKIQREEMFMHLSVVTHSDLYSSFRERSNH